MTEKTAAKLDRLLEIVDMLLKSGDPRKVAIFLSNKHPEDVAMVLEHLSSSERINVFKHLPIELQGDSIIYLDDPILDETLRYLNNQDITELVSEMDTDDAIDLLAELDEEDRNQVLQAVSEDARSKLREMLKYQDNTAGGLMSTEFVALPGNKMVSEAIEVLKKLETDPQYVLVVDENNKLLGRVTVGRLLKGKPDEPLSDLMEEIPAVPPDMDQEDVARLFEKLDIAYLPVIDKDGKLLGIITFDDVMDVVEEEASEDIARLAGLSRIQSLILPPWQAAKNRLPWLLANLLTAFVASSVVALFKDTIDSFAYLAVFMPIVAGMGGNGGIQALALTVRALALKKISKRDAYRILVKEGTTGILIGLVIGIVTGIVAWLWVGKPLFGAIVFFALLLNMVVACVMGFLIPNMIALFGGDPALASGVIVTTFTDVTGYFLFLGLATVLLRQLL